MSPTLTAQMTQPGIVLGTAAYMSPEQARGQSVDERTDIWSFGCVLWESLTGETLFGGPTASDSIGAILQTEPDWEDLPADTPSTVRRLLRRCLAKDPHDRLHHIADARIELEDTEPPSEPTAVRSTRGYRITVAILAIALIASLAAWLLPVCATGSRPGQLGERQSSRRRQVQQGHQLRRVRVRCRDLTRRQICRFCLRSRRAVRGFRRSTRDGRIPQLGVRRG